MTDFKIKVDNTPLVSVCMTAYNQAAYIVDAIEGILMQQTNFRFELLIGEDCGNKDDTLSICRAYEAKNPDIIRVINDGKNHGMVANEQRLMDAAKGKYIAFCEADDYWIDPLKLQKQVDILEKDITISGVTCKSKIVDELGNDKGIVLLSEIKEDTLFDFEYLVKNGCGFQTASFIFRKEFIKKMPPMPTSINGWDRAVFWLSSLYGNIYCFVDIMSVYRKNSGGISTRVTTKELEEDCKILKWLKKSNVNFDKFALLADIHLAIMSCSVKIGIYSLYKHFFYIKYYSHLSSFDLTQLNSNAFETMLYRLNKRHRRIFRYVKSYL